jgi:small subunit ribosomal protein S14
MTIAQMKNTNPDGTIKIKKSKGPDKVGHGWTDWRMIRDWKRRKCVVEHAKDRIRINAIRKNTILPVELREDASKEIHAFPINSNWNRCTHRCIITSRGRGNVFHFRVSRIMFRHFADYNKLAGVQRAMW